MTPRHRASRRFRFHATSSSSSLAIALLITPLPGAFITALGQDTPATAATAAADTQPAASATVPALPPDAYHDHVALTAWLRDIAARHPQLVTLASIGKSLEGRDLWMMRVAAAGEVEPDQRPALLIVANLDGDHLVGSEVAAGVALRLAEKAAAGDEGATAFLRDHALYVVPRVNPDAAERYFAPALKTERRRNARPDDADRDMVFDEDGPDDLNGDGLITMMRVYEDEPSRHDTMPDENDPRASVKAEADKGERATFHLLTEGLDNDGDGEINEDDFGGVDLNRNFMHGWKQHDDGVGLYPLSEPEPLALIQFVLDHQNIACALTYGRHDNLNNAPDNKQRDPAGAPVGVEGDDLALHGFIGERFKEVTGLKNVSAPASDGAFHAWAYSQFGIPSFATPLWGRPEVPKKEDEKKEGDGEAATQPAADGEQPAEGEESGEEAPPDDYSDLLAAAQARGLTDVTRETIAALPKEQIEQYRRMIGSPGPGGDQAEDDDVDDGKKKKNGKNGKSRAQEEVDWLAYSDELRGGEGFIAWASFDHPQLGRVEIGGWAPYFKTNPPAAELATIADKQADFVLDLASRLPDVALSTPEIKRLSPGLYEVKAALVNDGYLPAGTHMAVRNRRARPHVVRLSLPDEQVVAGARVNKTWRVPGSGGRVEYRWIVRAPDDSPLTIVVFSEKYGQRETTVNLTDNTADSGAATEPVEHDE